MSNTKKEYFNDYYYFLITENETNIELEYSLNTVLTESKSTKKKFKKEYKKELTNKIQNLIKSNKKLNKKELDELVDNDGTFLTSKIRLYNKTLSPRKTMDQTVNMTKYRNPFPGQMRVYWAESTDENDDIINEVNFSDTFGYEETMDKDFKSTMKQFDKMGVKEPDEKLKRTKQLGKRRNTKVVKNKKGEKIIKNLNLFEKESLEETKKQKMIKIIEDIIANKSKNNSDVVGKEDSLSKILMKNLENIKKFAEKEGISINKLINILKK
jgi:hypothetical protein